MKEQYKRLFNLAAIIVLLGMQTVIFATMWYEHFIEIESYSFAENKHLKKIIFEQSEIELQIESNAFHNCNNLESFYIPKQLKQFNKYILNECNNLKEIIIPSKVSEIKSNAFANCTSLSHVEGIQNVKTIGSDCFWNCAFHYFGCEKDIFVVE